MGNQLRLKRLSLTQGEGRIGSLPFFPVFFIPILLPFLLSAFNSFGTTVLFNVSYSEGMANDFSNVVVELLTPTGGFVPDYSIEAIEEGKWALLNISVPERDDYSISISVFEPEINEEETGETAEQQETNEAVPVLFENDTGLYEEVPSVPLLNETIPLLNETAGINEMINESINETALQGLPDFYVLSSIGEYVTVSKGLGRMPVDVSKNVYERVMNNETVRVIVKYRSTPDTTQFESAKISEIPSRKLLVLNMDYATFVELVNAQVVRIYPDTPMSAALSETVPLIGADAVHENLSITGAGVGICLLDTGVDYNAERYGGTVANGYDFVNEDEDSSDDNGHGTFMASIIHTIAPSANILAVKVLDSTGVGYSSDIIRGIEYCRENAGNYNLKIVSMSFGGGRYYSYCNSDPVAEAVNDAYLDGLFIVAAAGNDGSDYITAPACAGHAVAVSSTTKDDTISSFSNMNGLVDLLAPGEGVTAEGLAGEETRSGTSISTAHVSGASALLFENDSSLSQDAAEERFKTTGLLIEYNGANYSRINVYNAIMNITTGTPTNQTVNETNVSSNIFAIRTSTSEEYAGSLFILQNNEFMAFDNTTSITKGFYNIKFVFKKQFERDESSPQPFADELLLNDLLLDPNTTAVLRVESLDFSATPFGLAAKKVFAIDPSALNFTSGGMKLRARGSELYKCKEWDFDAKVCSGSWTKIMDLVPGEMYEISISADDPAYAEYDSTLGAPVCRSTESPCIANSSLLISRDNIGGTAEPNQPNTIDTCTDGASGTYGSDESLENITITDMNRSYFVGGDTVNVSVWVHPYSGGGDYLDIFYSNSTSPLVWKLRATLGPVSGTYQELSATFTLDPVGGQHAVRGQFRYGGANTTNCSTNSYDDHDDVAFQVKTPLSACGVISAPGEYALNQNVSTTGTCFIINAQNVTFDCQRYSISGDKGSGDYGFYVNRTKNVTIKNCIVYSFYNAIYHYYSNNSIYQDNSVYNNSLDGFYILGYDNNLTNNSAFLNSDVGFNIAGGSNNVLVNNSAFSNSNIGFYVPSSNNNLINNSAFANAYYGFYIYGSNTNLTSCTAHSNSYPGFYIYLSANNTRIVSSRAYNNTGTNYGQELAVEHDDPFGDPFTLNISGFIVDNPAGNMQNYTNMSLYDVVQPEEMYYIKWASAPSSLPSETISFAGKYVNITGIGGSVSIDSITWHWSESETSGYDESKFELWKYNASGWTLMNNSPNTTANTLSLTNMNPASTYGILQRNVSGCQVITTPGSYQLATNAIGAPNNASEVFGISWACIKIATSNVTFDCAGYNITNNGTANAAGVVINGSIYTNVTIKDCPSISGYGVGAYVYSADGNVIQNVTSRNNTIGFRLMSGANYNILTDNKAYNNSYYGFYIYQSFYNNITNNLAYNNSQYGFTLTSSSENNKLINNTAHSNSQYGFYLFSSGSNQLENNTAYRNVMGFHIQNSNSNQLIRNTASNHSGYAFYVNNSLSNILANNYAYNGTAGIRLEYSNYTNLTNNTVARTYGNGVVILNSSNSNLTGNTIYNSSSYGLYIYDANNTIARNTYLYNNRDGAVYIYATNTPKTVYLSNLTLDSPMADLKNYTSLTINDTLETALFDSGYIIDWAVNTSALPSEHFSFRQKYVNILNLTPSVSIDSITWHWLDSEAGGVYNENKFELWKYNASGWTLLNDTPDVSANTLGLTNMNPASIYGILQNNLTCQVIKNPGNYQLTTNAIGAPNSASEVSGISWACIKIATSNVTFDCAGYNITNNGTANAAGVVINGSIYTNVTIKNCPSVSGYSYGVYIYGADSNVVQNVTARNNTYGFYLRANANYNVLENDTAYNNSNGFYIYQSSYNNITNSRAFNNSNIGYIIASSFSNNLRNNTAYNNSNYGFYLTQGYYCLVENNTAYLNTRGYYLQNSEVNVLLNNNASHNSGFSFYINSSNENNLTGNIAYNNTGAIRIENSGNVTLTNNTVEKSAVAGFLITYSENITAVHNIAKNNQIGFALYDSATSSKLINNTAYDNSNTGFYLYYSSSNNLTNNNAFNNTYYGYLLHAAAGNFFSNNNASKNSYAGFLVNASSNLNTFTQDVVYDNGYGFYIYSSNLNTFKEGQIYNNSQYAYVIFNSANSNNLSNNTIYRNLAGIGIQLSSSNILEYNVINNCTYGINLIGSASDNIITGNNVFNNSAYQMSIGGASTGNLIYNNIFNASQGGGTALDNGAGNFWNTTQQTGPNIIGGRDIGGNYYSDYTGADGNGDGIGDTEDYNIPGTAGAIDYLPLTNSNTVYECFYANVENATYVLSANLAGNKSDGACITINSTNVTIDCVGYNITGNATGTTVGIYVAYVSGKADALIKNCNVRNYTYGVYAVGSNYTSIINTTIENITSTGVYYLSSFYGNVTGCRIANVATSHCIRNVYSSGARIINNNISNCAGAGIYASGSNSIRIVNNTIYNASIGIEDVGQDQYINISNNIISYCRQAGIWINQHINTIFTSVLHNNTCVYTSGPGINIKDSNRIDLYGNNVSYNTPIGFNLTNISYSSLAYNIAYNNSYYNFRLLSGHNNTLIGNLAYNASDPNYGTGFHVENEMDDTLTNNSAFNNYRYGFAIASTKKINVSGNTAYNNLFGFLFSEVNDTIITNSTAYNGDYGFYFSDSSYINISNSHANNNGNGFLIGALYFPCIGIKIINSTAHNNGIGASVAYSNFTTFQNFSSYNNSQYGIYVYNSNSFGLQDKSSLQNNTVGLYMTSSSGIATNGFITDASFVNNNEHGIALINVQQNFIYNNTIYENGKDGIYISNSDNNTLVNNVVYDNAWQGPGYYQLFIGGSSSGNLIYNNIFNTTFTNRVVGDSSSGINFWNTTQQTGPNIIGGRDIGGNYYSDYTGADGNGDGIGDTEDYNIPGTAGAIDYLPLTNSNTVYECFYADVPNSAYILGYNLTGNKSDHACITILASNVTINCLGNHIIGNATGMTYGIKVYKGGAESSANITIGNCTVHNYTYGYFFGNTVDSLFINDTGYNNSYGFYVNNSYNTVFFDIIAFNNSLNGIFITSSDFNAIEYSNVFSNNIGVEIDSNSVENLITGTNVSNNTNYGIYVTSIDTERPINTTIWSCNLQNNTQRNIIVSNAINTLIYDYAIHEGGTGIYIEETTNTTIQRGRIENTSYAGIAIYNSTYPVVAHTFVRGADAYGCLLRNSRNASFFNVSSNENHLQGFVFWGYNGEFYELTAENNSLVGIHSIDAQTFLPGPTGLPTFTGVFLRNNSLGFRFNTTNAVLYNVSIEQSNDNFIVVADGAPYTAVTFYNLTIKDFVTNSSVTWPDSSSITLNNVNESINSSVVILDVNLVSINTSLNALAEVKKPANVTLGSVNCSIPGLKLYKSTDEFPPGVPEVVGFGFECQSPNCINKQCLDNRYTFETSEFSGYATQGDLITDCFYATHSGLYELSANLVGNKSDHACITVIADDVVINCSGYNITGNYDATVSGEITYGVLLNRSANGTTIRDCTVSNYTIGFYLNASDYGNIINNTAYGNYNTSSLDDLTGVGFYVRGQGGDFALFNNLTNNTAYNNSKDGFFLYYKIIWGTVLDRNVIYKNGRHAINLGGDVFYTNITNNIIYNHYAHGIYLYNNCNNSVIANNSIYNSTAGDGIVVYKSGYNIIADNYVYNVSIGYGVGDYNNVTNNTAYRCHSRGANVDGFYNNFIDNKFYDSVNRGITLDYDAAHNNFTSNFINGSLYGIALLSNASNNTFSNNSLRSNNWSIYVNDSYDNLFENNALLDDVDGGFYISNSTDNDFVGNYVKNTDTCFLLTNQSHSNNLTHNRVVNCTAKGFFVNSSQYNVLIENNATYGGTGFYVATNSFATNLTGNRAENTADGFVIISSSAPTLRDNYVIGGTGYGYHISVVTNANFSNDTVIGKPSIGFYFDTYSGEFKGLYAENNSNYGVYSSSTSGSTVFNNTYLVNNSVGVGIKSTQTSMYNTHIKQVNNNFIKILDSSSLLKLERNTTIENIPTGTSVRYPNLVELDTTDDSIDEVNTLLTTNLASINTTYTTELATAANITLSGVDCSQPNLNVFRAPGFPQSVAEVIATGTVCNAPTCTNKQCSGGFYTFDVSTFSGYSTTNISSCMVIGSPGDYALTSAVSGAPITVSDVYGITRACIVISASNVTFSCAGYNVTNNGTLDAAGILVNGSSPIRTNVTIKDCPYVAFYEQGVYLHYTNRSIVQNTTSYNNTENGFYLYYSNENNLTNNIAYNNTNRGVYVHYSNYNRIRNITAYNQQSSSSGTLSLYSGSYNILTDNNIYNNTGHGIFVSVSGNNTIANNSVYNNGYYGIYFYYGGDNKAENNTVYKNYYGFYLDTSPNALLSSNDVYNNTYDGFELRSSKINVTDNRIRYNGGGGVYGIGSWFIIRNNTIYNNSQHGIIILNSDNATVVENNISNHLTYQSISFSNVKDGVISNNVIFKGYRGVETDGTGLSQKINITNNIVYNMSDTCLSISCTSCRIINNTAYYCGSYGISLGLNENIIENNTAYNNSRSGFYIHSSKNNCTNNTAYFNTQSGFYVYGDYNNIIDNVAYNNSQYGFATYYANANNFTNNTAYSNTLSGFYISDFSDNNTLFNNTAYDNNQYGIYVNNVNRTVFVNTHVYANKPAAAYITLTYRSINVSNLTVDNPVGNFQNYTQLSFYHFNPSSNAQAYTINWTRNSTALPVNRFSFAQKFVDISTVSGTVSINSVTWHWLDSELGSSYKENYFELWKYNASGWTLVNNSPDTSANTLSLTNMNPASIYGILQYNASECMLINLSGEYTLRNNVVGAPINASPLAHFACIKIATSNVLFDCAGYNITDNGTAAVYTTYGILLNGSLTNVTVRNCPSVSNYTYGIWVHQSENSTITNSTSHNNVRGVDLHNSSGINITNIGAHNNSARGIYLFAGGSNRIENSSASGSYDGFYIEASSSNTLSSNLAYNNSHAGFFLNQSNNSVFTGDTASNNLHGFEFDNAHFNTLTNATAFGNNQYGFEIYSSTGNNFTNILVYGNGIYGFKMVISDQNILTNVTARDNTNTGVYINTGSDYNLVRNSSFYNNSGYGFGIEHSMYNNVTDSYAYENAQGGFLVWDHSYYNKITNCTAYNNSGYGLTLSFGSENNTLLNITAYNNSGGIKFDDVYTNNATDAALYMNNRSDGYELYFSATSQSNIVTNTFLYTTSNYVLQEGMSLPENNLSNFSIGYNSTIGIINWRLLNITNITLNSTNVIPYIDFVSLNDSRNPQANRSANVTIIGPSCDVEVLVKRGYPLTRAEILADGTRCTNCNIISCNKTTHVTRFDVPGWSGYTLAEWCFYADTPNTVYNLTRNLRGNKSDQICITVNASNVTINCAGFNVTGYEPGVTWGIKAFDVFGIDVENCTVSNYTYGLEFYNVNHSIIFNVTSYNNSEGILTSYGTNNTLFKNIAYNNTDGIFLSSTSKNNLADNTAFGNTHGFILMSAATTNNTLNNNTAYNNSQYGFYLYFASNNTMANNIAYNNTAGFTLSAAKYNSISDNTAHNNSNGFYLLAASNNTLNNNTAFYNAYGFYVNNSADNNLTNCTAYNNSYHGFYLLSASTNNLLSDNLAKFQGSHGFVVSSSSLNKLTNNTAYRNSYGFDVDSSSNNTLAYNFAYNNTVGFALQTGSSENNLTDNLAYFNKYGFRLEVASDNRLENNSAFNNSVQGGLFGSGSGFYIGVSSERNALTNNSAYDNAFSGFFIDQTSSNIIQESSAYRNEYGSHLYYGEGNNITESDFYNNSNTGVYLNRSSNTLLRAVSAHDNQKSGLYLDSSPDTIVTNCTSANNSEYGIAILNSNNTFGANVHLYKNNKNDVYAFASVSYKTLYFSNLTIDNPAGNFENYTSLTINDTLEATAMLDNGYTVNWTTNSSALPAYRFSFREKYVEITNITSSVSIDSITWHWLDSEVTGDYNESKFELWKYNVSGWTLMNDTPDVSANILGLTNMNPASTYGILQRNVSGCQVITTPGSYQLSANAEGAPFDASPLLDYVCVKIASSDVLFDCAGYNITDNGTAAVYTTYGILLNGSLTNVTVRNCPSVSNYTYGIYVYQSENSTITNSTSHNNMADGIKLDGSNYNNLTWDAARGNSNDGFYLIDSSYNVIEGSTAYDNSNYGFRLTASATGSTYNNLTNNTAYNNYYGFVTVGSSTNNRFVNNTAHDNSGNGFYISSANNTLIENDAYSNNNGFEQSAFFGPPADGNYYESNAAFNNSYNGFILFFVSYNVFVNNTAYNNSWALYGDGAAFSLRDSSYNNLSDNLAYDNYEYAFRLDNPWGAGSAYNRIINNTVRNHGLASFYLDTLANNNTINSNDVQNSTDGFVVHGAENNITNNLVYNHTGYGVYIEVNPSSGGENRNRVAMNNISLTSIGVVVNISLTGTIINNIINDSGIGIAIYGTNATDVSDNRVHNISQYGIEIAPAESGGKWSVVYGASFNNITYNNIFDIGEYGVYVHPYYNGSDWFNATDNQYLYNTITRTGRGMYLNSTSNNNITGNNISNSSYGLYIDPSYNNTIIENNLYNNSQDGLYLEDSHNNTIRNNTAYNNSRAGFYLVSSTENNLSLNNITNNTLIGLYLNSNSNSNSLSQNYICFNDKMDINNSDTTSNGVVDTCDYWYNWSENGHWGCTFACTSLWHRFFGNTSGTLYLTDNASGTTTYMYRWENATGFNVYFTDIDALISWKDLQAISRTTSGAPATNDFFELDAAFKSGSYADNISVTYSTDGSTPRATETYVVYGKTIANVPVANSSVEPTVFKTGILWDTSDGGTEYSNAYNQSTVWVVNVNTSAGPDKYGYYHYLAMIPYTLADYEGSTSAVAIYLEVK